MGKADREALGAEGKKDVWFFDPEKLVLVDDVASAIYDDRVKGEADEKLVLNIMHQGVIEPVIVRKNTETGKVEVVAGRRRVLACREANRRLRKKGCEPHNVPAIIRKAEAADLLGVMVSENELREEDSPLGRAKKLQRFLDLGRSEEQAATIFGCSLSTVKNLLSLLDAPKEVRAAVQSGKIAASDGYKLAKLEPDDAKKRLKTLEKAAPREPGKKRRASGREAAAALNGAPVMRGKREITEKLAWAETADEIREAARPGIVATLKWVLGGEWE